MRWKFYSIEPGWLRGESKKYIESFVELCRSKTGKQNQFLTHADPIRF
jgi:hypothetical protein